ncbi:MAG: hypothetical protein LBL58_17095 [Tannerellaceae bacterium]|nr:hypothetical protein [Tannerellaceae bacterium]
MRNTFSVSKVSQSAYTVDSAINVTGNQYYTIVGWNASSKISTFTIGSKTLSSTANGSNGAGINIWNQNDYLMAQDYELYSLIWVREACCGKHLVTSLIRRLTIIR